MVTEAPAWEPDGRALPRILSGIRGSCTTCYIYTNLDESLPEKGTQIYDVFVNVYIAPRDTDDCSVRSGPFLVTSIHELPRKPTLAIGRRRCLGLGLRSQVERT